MIRLFCITLLLSSSFACGHLLAQRSDAETPDYRPGELLLQYSGSLPDLWEVPLPDGATLYPIKTLSPDWNLYLVGVRPENTPLDQIIAALAKWPGVEAVQRNHRTLERNLEPNDPGWAQQQDMLLIGAPKVWESDAGGLTPRGDTIVVAVLEKGILFTHPDLEGNRWYNHEEIPDNDLDDDQNGYVDDFRGWNPRTSADDTGTNGNHGTAVTGIIGAVGNNAIGVAGVNWKVKMMSICQVEFEDEIIAAYQYVNTQRKRYNQSNGTQGAFVVATNASFGIDNAKPEDHPVWCAVYDSLGKSGILNIGATTNQNTDVEAEGDMPTRCTSPYLIAVNNVNKLGVKEPATGYGAVSIDLGAPGTDTYTTSNAGTNLPSYGKLGGTSAATPHVTGAVGLLYSLDCPTFTSDALANPEQCAARVRDAILLNTEPEASLTGITTTGGYLQVAKAMQSVIDYCKGTVGILDILEIRTRPDYRQFQAYYQTPTYENYGFEVHHMSGQLMFAETLKPQRFQPNYVEIDASSYPPGVYVMTLSKGFAKVSRKFIKI